jgi:hypothetical protein
LARRRRVQEEVPSAEGRPRVPLRREADDPGPKGEVLRLQKLAGNSAVNALVRAPALLRQPTEAPAPTDEKPKQKGITVVVDDPDIGTFVVDSAHFSGARAVKGERPSEVHITRRMDELSVKFHQRALNGESFGTVTITFPGAPPFVMKNVMISSYQVGGSSGEPYESMTFTAAPEEEKAPPS